MNVLYMNTVYKSRCVVDKSLTINMYFFSRLAKKREKYYSTYILKRRYDCYAD